MGFSLPVTGGLVRTGAERAQLVRRTYSLVFVSILVTIVGATYALSNAALMAQVQEHRFLSMIAVFVPLIFANSARTTFPFNIAMVLLFTLAEGVVLGSLLQPLVVTQPGLLSQAAWLTVGTFGVLTAYAFVSRRDFSAWRSFLMTGLFVLIGTMFFNMFFHNETAGLWIAAVTVFLFSGLLIFDTWRLRNVYGPDDYVPAAVNIYLDLLNLFLALVRILGGRRN